MEGYVMPYKTRLETACEEIENAQEAVAAAQTAYSRGGSPDGVNRAARALADAHLNYQQVSGGRGRLPQDDR